MQIDIIMLTAGREYYLEKAVDSIIREYKIAKNLDLKLILFGYKISPFLVDKVDKAGIKITTCSLPHKEKTTKLLIDCIKYIRPSSDFVMKMDDDCEIVSTNFFEHVENIKTITKGNEISFSPFPVGLINNLGGPPPVIVNGKPLRRVEFYKDTYYTIRFVSHVGGFARIATTKTFLTAPFEADLSNDHSGNEDGIFSAHCIQNKVTMFYLENAMIVEHQESTLGQKERYKDYFK